ncbi:MAG: YitT family protein [Alkalibacterium sp.]|nr:YitT family protein [Alkalibacterium sp.]
MIAANAMFGWDPAMFQYALNIPLLALCLLLGERSGIQDDPEAACLFPSFLMFIGDWDPVTREPLLAALFGGGITGLGIGIVFRAKSSTGEQVSSFRSCISSFIFSWV